MILQVANGAISFPNPDHSDERDEPRDHREDEEGAVADLDLPLWITSQAALQNPYASFVISDSAFISTQIVHHVELIISPTIGVYEERFTCRSRQPNPSPV